MTMKTVEPFELPELPDRDALTAVVEEHFGPIDIASPTLDPKWRVVEGLYDLLDRYHQQARADHSDWVERIAESLRTAQVNEIEDVIAENLVY